MRKVPFITSPTTRVHPWPRIAAALLGVFLLWQAANMVDEYYGILRTVFIEIPPLLGGSDFPAFYGGASLFLDDPSNAYDIDAQTRAIKEAKGLDPNSEELNPWWRYYNPPVYSLLLAPLTQLDLLSAFFIAFWINLLGFILLLLVLKRILKEKPLVFWLLALGLISSQPVNYAFWHGQPTIFLAAALAGLQLSYESKLWRRTGVLWAWLIIKPQWLLLPALSLSSFSRPMIAAFAALMTLLLAPFLILGPGGIQDYVELLIGRGAGDLTDESFSEAVLSWSGFFRGLSGEPQLAATLIMATLTIAIFLMVRRSSNPDLLPMAAAAAFLLIMPHSHPQEWIILAPAAAFLYRTSSNSWQIAVPTALLLLVQIGLTNWSGLEKREQVIYWPTVGAFGLLVWTFVLSESSRLRVPRAGTELNPVTWPSSGTGPGQALKEPSSEV